VLLELLGRQLLEFLESVLGQLIQEHHRMEEWNRRLEVELMEETLEERMGSRSAVFSDGISLARWHWRPQPRLPPGRK